MDSYSWDGKRLEFSRGYDECEDMMMSSYYDMDKNLTKEINSLEVPDLPNDENLLATDDIDLDMNKYTINWEQLQLGAPEVENDNNGLSYTNKHKRGLSGTAIFGFTNHNKTLSINSVSNNLNKECFNALEDYSNSVRANELNLKIPASDGGSFMNEGLMKQQEELRKALEKQKQLNMKLERQLMENKLQQEELQNALNQQETSPYHLMASPHSERTPQANGKTANNEIIVTSNSKLGTYQFPPQSMISPPMTNTSLTGSPLRMNRKKFDSRYEVASEMHQSESGDNSFYDNLKPPNPRYEMTSPNSDYRNYLSNSGHLNSTRHLSPRHRKKESAISTVSTIPQNHEEEISDNEHNSVLGLGISRGTRSTGPLHHEMRDKSNAFKTLPTIEGSVNNTPLKRVSHLPQKHTFQHTPTKYNSGMSNENRIEELFVDISHRSPTRNPFTTDTYEHGASRYQTQEIPVPDPSLYAQRRPSDTKYKIVETPSPLLKRHNQIIETPIIESNEHLKPKKITRKLTTLPRGSIDIYVNELPDKQFECLYPSCHKIFKRRYNVRSHIQTHLQDRPYACDVEGCDKAFVRNHDLARHKKKHYENNFHCVCGKSFQDEELLLRHKTELACNTVRKNEQNQVHKSPAKSTHSVHSSPVKDQIEKDKTGYVVHRMEEQLKNEVKSHGLLEPPSKMLMTTENLILSPTLSSGFSDIGSPLNEIVHPAETRR